MFGLRPNQISYTRVIHWRRNSTTGEYGNSCNRLGPLPTGLPCKLSATAHGSPAVLRRLRLQHVNRERFIGGVRPSAERQTGRSFLLSWHRFGCEHQGQSTRFLCGAAGWCGGPVRQDRSGNGPTRLSVRTDIPEWLKRRSPDDSVGFKGGGYYVGFVGMTQTGFGMEWKPEMSEVPRAGVSRQGPFWPMPLTLDQLRALIGQPDKIEKVIEINE
jgi:hypothetical protein